VGYPGHQFSIAPGRPLLHRFLSLSQTSAGNGVSASHDHQPTLSRTVVGAGLLIAAGLAMLVIPHVETPPEAWHWSRAPFAVCFVAGVLIGAPANRRLRPPRSKAHRRSFCGRTLRIQHHGLVTGAYLCGA
jgi:peptidoglycan/LPS O-acetylase OafA/YrhL